MENLILRHMAYADRLAFKKWKNLPKRIDIEELKSAAYLGLVEAAGRYNEEAGVAFPTYAYQRIWHGMDDYLRELGFIEVSLDDADEDGLSSLKDSIPAPQDDSIAFEDVIDVVADGLGDQAKHLMRLYFFDELPMKEVGKKIGVSESRVSQMFSAYKREIRRRWTKDELGAELGAELAA